MFSEIIFHPVPPRFHSVSHNNGISYDMNNKYFKTLEITSILNITIIVFNKVSGESLVMVNSHEHEAGLEAK